MATVSPNRLTCNKAAVLALAGVGGLWLAIGLWKTSRFTYLHFLRSSSLDRYRSNSDVESWALVTGASDGIGKGFAEELCHRGFNVVLHGRNEKKLHLVRNELLEAYEGQQVRILVVDAVQDAGNLTRLKEAANELKDIKLKIMVNNVGGAADVKPLLSPFQDSHEDANRIQLELNVRFQTELTRLLLTQLIANQPACILNIGSASAELACCYLSVAGGVKAYQKAWSRSLSLEMKAERNDIDVLYYQLGMVSSGSSPRPTSLLVPSSRKMASACLDKVGCGRDIAYGYWPHELQFGLISLLPTFVVERVLIGMVRGMITEEQAALKSQ